MKKLNKGIFIVFEGIDGSGKTMQLVRTAEWVRSRGYHAVTLKEPTDGVWGQKIRSILAGDDPPVSLEEELELFIKDRRENIRLHVQPALDSGSIVLQDRYYYSTMAYQGARGFDVNEIANKHRDFIIHPDLVIIMDIDPEEGLRRILRQRKTKLSIFERTEYLRKVKEIYNSFTDPFIVHIDAGDTPDAVQSIIQQKMRTSFF